MKIILAASSQAFRFFLLLSLLSAVPYGAAAAEAQEDFSLKILDISANTRGIVRLIVSVTDQTGAPVKNLKRPDFKLNVEGLPIGEFTVEPISSAKNPLSVLLAIDVSGSMNGAPMDAAKRAAADFLGRLRPEDYAALLSFGSGTRVLSEFTSNKAAVKENLEMLRAGDKETWLWAATHESLTKTADAPTSRAAIVLLTDGKDEGSPLTEENVLGRIKGARVPIFALGFGENAQKAYLEEIAAASGGSFFYTPAAEELGQMYAQVYEQLENQYQIEFRFGKAAGEYIATLGFEYGGSEKTARASFLQALADVPAPVSPPKPALSNWLNYAVLGLLALLVVLTLVSFFFHWRSRKTFAEPTETQVELMIEGKRSLLSSPTANGDNRMTVLAQAPTGEAGLVVQLPNAPAYLPLVDSSIGKKFDEVVITRFDTSSRFRKERVYLLISDRSISRPDKQRGGHASVSLNQKSGRYQIKDLGSVGGTRLNGVRLNGAAYLENGDTIAIGTVSLKYYDSRSGGGFSA